MRNLSKYLLILSLAFLFMPSSKAQNSNSLTKTTSTPINSLSEPVASSAAKVTPLLIGANIPDVNLKSIEGKEVNLVNLVKSKPTVFIFYRGGWCPYCSTQLSQLRLIESQLVEMGYQLIAISPEKPETSQETLEKNKLNYLLLSDSLASAAKAFGIAFNVDDSTYELYKKYNLDLEKVSGEKHHILPVPSVFIAGTDGVVKFQYVNPDYKTRLSSEVILAAAKSLVSKGK